MSKLAAMTPKPTPKLLDRFGEDQRLSRLEGKRESGTGKEGGLSEPGDRLALTMTEAVLRVGRTFGVAHAEEGGEGRGGVHEGVHGRGEQRDRASGNPSCKLDRNQNNCDDETGTAGEPTQARVPPIGHGSGRQPLHLGPFGSCGSPTERTEAINPDSRQSTGQNPLC